MVARQMEPQQICNIQLQLVRKDFIFLRDIFANQKQVNSLHNTIAMTANCATETESNRQQHLIGL